MSRQQWIVVGVIAAIAAVTGLLVKRKSDSADAQSAAQSQLPAQQAEANYNVPPSIGAQVDNTGGMNFPQGQSGFMYTMSQANALPSSGNGQ